MRCCFLPPGLTCGVREARFVLPFFSYLCPCRALLAFFYLEHGQDDSRRSRLCFVGSVLSLFLAYESKITNLYFLPGILIILLLRHRRMGPAIRYGLYLLGLYVIEHIAYFLAVGDPLGRLGIIAKTILLLLMPISCRNRSGDSSSVIRSILSSRGICCLLPLLSLPSTCLPRKSRGFGN